MSELDRFFDNRFFEDLEDDLGDVGDYEEPEIGAEEEWKFADPEKVMTEDYAIDIAADMMIDGECASAADYFIAIGQALVAYSNDDNLEEAVVNAVRQKAREQLLDLYEGEITENFLKPVSNAQILRDITYLFKQLIKLQQNKFGTGK
jgi:hypothetical protein